MDTAKDLEGLREAHAVLFRRVELLAHECRTFREWYVTEWGEVELGKDFPTLDSTLVECEKPITGPRS